MREYLFRGKDPYAGEWIEGSLLNVNVFDEDHGPRALIFPNHLRGTYVDLGTVGQFTGLLDKNGRKIFEGDIVRIAEHHADVNGIYQVFYCIANHCYALKRNPAHHHHYISFSDLTCFNHDSEVIGNIYDNLDLLGVEEE